MVRRKDGDPGSGDGRVQIPDNRARGRRGRFARIRAVSRPKDISLARGLIEEFGQRRGMENDYGKVEWTEEDQRFQRWN